MNRISIYLNVCMNLFKKRTKIILQDYRNDRKYKNVGTNFCTTILCFNLKVFWSKIISTCIFLNPKSRTKVIKQKTLGRDGGYVEETYLNLTDSQSLWGWGGNTVPTHTGSHSRSGCCHVLDKENIFKTLKWFSRFVLDYK